MKNEQHADRRERTMKLKPCPFCGGANVEAIPYVPLAILPPQVLCRDCGASMRARDAHHDHGRAWNRRAGRYAGAPHQVESGCKTCAHKGEPIFCDRCNGRYWRYKGKSK